MIIWQQFIPEHIDSVSSNLNPETELKQATNKDQILMNQILMTREILWRTESCSSTDYKHNWILNNKTTRVCSPLQVSWVSYQFIFLHVDSLKFGAALSQRHQPVITDVITLSKMNVPQVSAMLAQLHKTQKTQVQLSCWWLLIPIWCTATDVNIPAS